MLVTARLSAVTLFGILAPSQGGGAPAPCVHPLATPMLVFQFFHRGNGANAPSPKSHLAPAAKILATPVLTTHYATFTEDRLPSIAVASIGDHAPLPPRNFTWTL